MQLNNLTDREILILVAEKTERLDKAINGNGQKGLVQRLAVAETELARLDERTIGASDKKVVGISGVLSVISALLMKMGEKWL